MKLGKSHVTLSVAERTPRRAHGHTNDQHRSLFVLTPR